MHTHTPEINFTDFRITRLNFSLNTEFSASSQHAQVHTEFKIRHELQDTRLKVFLAVIFKDSPTHKIPFLLSIEGVATFKLQRPPSASTIQSLVKQYCAAAIFPYLREAIADITRRAGFPPLHIPQVDFAHAFTQEPEPGSASPNVLH
ncbi:MAG: protein-export chaperone SecB [Desulfuromonadaceae bacterium]|nr:protein-export chaperone SecB [Desulfuromonadaceae bacterium]